MTDDELSTIWAKVSAAWNQTVALKILQAHFNPNMDECHRTYYGRPNILHVSIPLFNLVRNATFRKPGYDPSCPAGGYST